MFLLAAVSSSRHKSHWNEVSQCQEILTHRPSHTSGNKQQLIDRSITINLEFFNTCPDFGIGESIFSRFWRLVQLAHG